MGNWGATLRGLRSLRALADVVATTALWLLLAGNLHGQEVAVGVLVGIIVAIVGLRVRGEVDHRAASVVRYVPTLLSQYLGAFRDCWLLSFALLRRPVGRPPAGRLRVVPFDFGDASPEAVGRRVVTTLGTSLQPNSYVLGFDREQGLILVHELVDDGRKLVSDVLAETRGPDPEVSP